MKTNINLEINWRNITETLHNDIKEQLVEDAKKVIFQQMSLGFNSGVIHSLYEHVEYVGDYVLKIQHSDEQNESVFDSMEKELTELFIKSEDQDLEIELDNLDKARIVFVEGSYDEIEVENEHLTRYPVSELTISELQLFIDMYKMAHIKDMN